MLCFECLDELSSIQAAFHGCIQYSIDQQLLKSSQTSHFGAVDIVKPMALKEPTNKLKSTKNSCITPVNVVEPIEIIQGQSMQTESMPSPQFTVVTYNDPIEFIEEQSELVSLTQTSHFTNVDAIEFIEGKAEMAEDDEIIADFELPELSNIEDYLTLSSFKLLEDSQIEQENVKSFSPKSPQKGKLYKCEHCARKFTKSPSLKKHIESTHQKAFGKRLPTHQVSPSNSNGKAGGKKHKNEHHLKATGKQVRDVKVLMEPLSYCNICPKAFQTARGLTLHKRTHNVTVFVGKLI